MSEISLKNNFISVSTPNGLDYGGNQNYWKKSSMNGYGCGIIGVANILLYKSQESSNDESSISQEDYMDFCDKLRRYLPILPFSGINGIELSLGFNTYCRINKIPLVSSWGVSRKNIYKEINSMLENDIPVIISAGPGFPQVWKKGKLNLYNFQMNRATSCRAHYMTVTASDSNCLTVSSWGRKYFIKKSEFDKYIKENSNGYLSSILKIKNR